MLCRITHTTRLSLPLPRPRHPSPPAGNAACLPAIRLLACLQFNPYRLHFLHGAAFATLHHHKPTMPQLHPAMAEPAHATYRTVPAVAQTCFPAPHTGRHRPGLPRLIEKRLQIRLQLSLFVLSCQQRTLHSLSNQLRRLAAAASHRCGAGAAGGQSASMGSAPVGQASAALGSHPTAALPHSMLHHEQADPNSIKADPGSRCLALTPTVSSIASWAVSSHLAGCTPNQAAVSSTAGQSTTRSVVPPPTKAGTCLAAGGSAGSGSTCARGGSGADGRRIGGGGRVRTRGSARVAQMPLLAPPPPGSACENWCANQLSPGCKALRHLIPPHVPETSTPERAPSGARHLPCSAPTGPAGARGCRTPAAAGSG